jgi:ABC-2 type transport system permease protein
MKVGRVNLHGMRAIYMFEMARFRRTLWQSLATPVITTALYFVVFGAAIGARIGEIDGVSYGAFIVPGLMMLTVFTESLNNAAFGIYMPKFTGTIYELLSAPISPLETVLAFVGAAATKSVILGLVILGTASLFVPLQVLHPASMAAYLVLVAVAFSLAGFVIGVWAQGFEELQFVPMLVITPLSFLGGAFYSIRMLPETFQAVSLFNPIVYVISGFRWTFYGTGDVAIGVSVFALLAFLAACLLLVWWMFRTGYRLKS